MIKKFIYRGLQRYSLTLDFSVFVLRLGYTQVVRQHVKATQQNGEGVFVFFISKKQKKVKNNLFFASQFYTTFCWFFHIKFH